MVNVSLLEIVVDVAKKLGNLGGKKVLVLGLTFKRDSDDVRDSMSTKIISLLESEFVERVETHNPFVEPERLEMKIPQADVIFDATDHSVYERIDLSDIGTPDCLIVDPWFLIGSNVNLSYFCRKFFEKRN